MNTGSTYERYVISGATPFCQEDVPHLAADAPAVFAMRAPVLAAVFAQYGWKLPRAVDRVYYSGLAERTLDWTPRYDWTEVLAEWQRGSAEVLPPARHV